MGRHVVKFLFAAFVCAAALAGLLAFIGPAGVKGLPGARALAVLSGSMEPSLHVGSVAFIRSYDPSRARVGDVVTFRTPSGDGAAGDDLTTHRIVGISQDGPETVFTTKGDANRTPDRWMVRASDIVGSPAFAIPWLGYLGSFARSRFGFIALVALPGLLLIGFEVASIVREVRRMRSVARSGVTTR